MSRIVKQAQAPENAVDLMAAKDVHDDAVAERLKKAGGTSPGQNGSKEAPAHPVGEIPFLAEDSVLLQMPNGDIVEVGPPGQSTVFMIARIMSDGTATQDVTNPMLVMMNSNIVRALLYVRAINGRAIRAPANMAEAQALANMLKDEGVDFVSVAMNKFWRTAGGPEDLPVLKKNLRQ